MLYLYELIDPRDNLPFYVGMTNNLQQRFYQHSSLRDANPKKNARIQEIRESGMKPKMRIVEEISDDTLGPQKEVNLIQMYLSRGLLLTNIRSAQIGNKRDLHITRHEDYNAEIFESLSEEFEEAEGVGNWTDPRAELDLFVTIAIAQASRREQKFINTWYEHQFDPGERFEGQKPIII